MAAYSFLLLRLATTTSSLVTAKPMFKAFTGTFNPVELKHSNTVSSSPRVFATTETPSLPKYVKGFFTPSGVTNIDFEELPSGLKELQERIDNFITAHEEQEEQAKRERESKLAEEGWTVVVHHKGGKKTTDPESGLAVGSVAAAAVRDKLEKKKSKDIGLDFYRFQRKEAHRSELMKLQSKFEEDKKRIQQLRAARKFKPY